MDLSLDDIIKKDRVNKRGRGRGASRGAGRGQQRQRGNQNQGGQERGNRNASNQNRPSAPYRRGNVEDRWSHDMYDGSAGGGRGGGGGGGDLRRRSSQDPAKLMISNLDFGVTDADVKELFGEFGPMRSAAVHYDRSGRSMGTAQVVFERRGDAARAMKQYGGVPLDGRPMKLELATDQISGGGGGGGRQQGAARQQGGAQRASRGGGGGGRGRGGGRGGRGGGRGGARQTREKKKPATAEQLDAELEAYVNSAK